MARFLALFLVVCGAAAFCDAAVTRSVNDIKEFENFLRNTVNGKPLDELLSHLTDKVNPDELSGKFEGDILLSEDQIKAMVDDYANNRNALTATNKLWPNKVVPYEINTSQFTAAQIATIEKGLDELRQKSCLTIRKRTSNDRNYVMVGGKNAGCYAYVGVIGGAQELNLQPNGCLNHGIIIHEFLHAIGFYHMQSTYDRDDWVRIVWEKIQSGQSHNFNKYTSAQVTNLGQSYDYGSVMHYSEYGFSIDGSKTIVPLKPYSGTIGQRVGLSTIDTNRLRRLYSC